MQVASKGSSEKSFQHSEAWPSRQELPCFCHHLMAFCSSPKKLFPQQCCNSRRFIYYNLHLCITVGTCTGLPWVSTGNRGPRDPVCGVGLDIHGARHLGCPVPPELMLSKSSSNFCADRAKAFFLSGFMQRTLQREGDSSAPLEYHINESLYAG